MNLDSLLTDCPISLANASMSASDAKCTLIEAERKEHSRKPNEARLRIEELYPDAVKIELFARTKIENWDAWGNETDKFEEKIS